MIVHIFIALAIATEVIWDTIEHRTPGNTGGVNHLRGILIRIAASIVLFHKAPLAILAYAGYFMIVFNPIMGYVVKKDIGYVGTTSWFDRVIGIIPPLPRLFLGTFVGILLTSVYYWPDLWLTLFNG